MMDDEKLNEVEKEEAEIKDEPQEFTSDVAYLDNSATDATPEDKPEADEQPEEQSAAERLDRIIKEAHPPVRPPLSGGIDPDEHARRRKRTLAALREHLRKRGIKHPLFDNDWNEPKGGDK